MRDTIKAQIECERCGKETTVTGFEIDGEIWCSSDCDFCLTCEIDGRKTSEFSPADRIKARDALRAKWVEEFVEYLTDKPFTFS